METRAFSFVVFTVTALAGCVPDVDDDFSRVSTPRVLAVRATPAEVGSQDATSVDALVAAGDGEDVPELTWQMCLARKPLTELGPVDQSCLELVPGGDDTRVALGSGERAELVPTREACELFGPLAPSPTAEDPKGGRPVDPDVTGGFYQPVTAFLGGTPSLGAVRLDCGLTRAPNEINAGYKALHNAGGVLIGNGNPDVSRLALIDGAETELEPDAAEPSASVRRGRTVSLRAEWQECPREPRCGDGICSEGEDTAACADDCTTPVSCTGAESYVWYDSSARTLKQRRESILVSWFATDGSFAARRTGVSETDSDRAHTEAKWTAPDGAGSVKLWAVIRDDRGGVSWQTYRLAVE